MARRRNLNNCFIAPLQKLTEPALFRILGRVIRDNQAELKRLNQERLYRGENIDGSDIEPGYKQSTERIKKAKGQPSDRVTLKNTGSFYDKIFTKVFAKAFEEDSRDKKTQQLREKYGPLILGLSDEDKAEFSEFIRPIFIARVRAYIGL